MGEDQVGIALALSDLKGAVDAGFARLDGRLDVALTRTDANDREIRDIKKRMSALEAKVWKISLMAAAMGAGGATGLWQLTQ